jgi:cystathionine beta-synthase
MSPPLPTVGSGEPLSAAVTALGHAGAALVLVDGKPAAMITRQDLLTYLSGHSA